MGAFRDLSGQKIKRWSVLLRASNSESGKTRWHCICECGREKIVRSEHLLNGRSSSCGCAHKEFVSSHGMYSTPEYVAYRNMQQRCHNEKYNCSHRYKGRGIECRFESFDHFYEVMGERPMGMSLERIDNDGHYEPGNVKWDTPKMQARNRSTNVSIEYQGETITAPALSDLFGIPAWKITDRIKKGWPVERVIHRGNFSRTGKMR
jgi:hypothetical protein